MNKLLVVLLTLTIVFGELAIVQFQAEAKRLVDEHAQALLQQARAAIGGDEAINAVNNLVSTGKISHKIKTPDDQERTLEGDVEMALETNGKIHKKVKLTFQADPTAAASEGGDVKKIVVENDKTILVHHSSDSNAEPGQEFRMMEDNGQGQNLIRKIEEHGAGGGQNEFAQLMLGLLLKSPASFELVYNYLGKSEVDGTAAEIIEATGAENFKTKLYLAEQTHLPLMITYRGMLPHPVFIFNNEGGTLGNNRGVKNVIFIKRPDGEKSVENSGDPKVFARKSDPNVGNADATLFPGKMMEEVEIQIRFSDFRQEGNLILPHKLTQYVNGQLDETTTIDSYEINATNLSGRFKDEMRILKTQ